MHQRTPEEEDVPRYEGIIFNSHSDVVRVCVRVFV